MSKKPYYFNTTISAEGIIANGQYGTAGQYLLSNSTGGIYWQTPPSAFSAGFGLTSNASHYYVNANTGIVANTDGTFVNSAYIQTITVNNANNATYLGTQNSSYYTNATNIIAGTLAEARLPYRFNQNLTTANTPSFTGATFTANVNISNNIINWVLDPVNDYDAANKRYVDAVAQGLNINEACHVATTDSLAVLCGSTVTYNNGTSGVGATLTLGAALASLDEVSLTDGDRILVKNETNAAHNGIYTRTSSTIFTRALDFDTSVEIASGDFTFVENGTTYSATGWVVESEVNTVGTDPVTWIQFSGAGAYTANGYVYLVGTQFSVNASTTATANVLVARDASGNFAANVITANLVGTANNANNFGGNLPAYYTNATNLSTGTVADARLNSANATQKGIMYVVDSLTNTSIIVAASANSVKAVYDSSTNASNISTGTLAYARLPSGLVNTSSSFTFGGTIGFNANVTLGTGVSFYANGTIGTAGQLLTSDGTSAYWGDPPAGGVTSILEGDGIAVDQNTGDVTISLVALTALGSAYSGGISDISIDTFGRVTSVTGSAGFLTNATLPNGTTSVKGIVQLSSATNDASNSLAATAGAVKQAYDLAASKGTGTVTSLTAGTGINLNPNPITTSGTVSLASGVISPVSLSSGISAITVDTYGRVTAVTGGANYLTEVSAGNGLTSTTVGSTRTLNVGAGPGISVDADTVGLVSGVVTAQSLTGGISALTVDTYGRVTSVTGGANYFNIAGSGLSSVGATVSVGAGTGISVNNDFVSLASGVIAPTTATGGISSITVDTYGRVTAVSGSAGFLTEVSAGNGMTSSTSGSTRTLDVVAGPGLTVSADQIALSTFGAGATTYSSGISAITVDLYGRVSSVTGSAGYVTTSGQSVQKYAALRYSYSYDYGTRYSPGTGFSYTTSGVKNVSSLTYNGDGDITINFSSNFSNANYKAFLQAPGDATHAMTGIHSQAIGSCRATTKYTFNGTAGQSLFNPGYTHNFMAVEFA